MDVRRAVAAVLLLGLLVGCSDDEPSAPPEPTESATGSPTPTSPPTAPDESREATAAGARAFVRYWIASFNYAMQTGDTAEFRRLYSDECRSCAEISRAIEDIYEPGGHVDSDGWRIKRFIETSMAGNSKASVRGLIILSPELIHHADSDKPDRRSGGEATATFSLSRGSSGWRVSNVVQGSR